LYPSRQCAERQASKFRRFKNQIRVEDSCGLLLFDSIDLQPSPDDLRKLGLLDGFAAWGSWYLLGDFAAWGIDAAAFCQANQDLSNPHGIGSISRLYRNGLSARFLSNRLEFIDKHFEGLRKGFRESIQRPYTALRK
jgi:urease accessory protein UreH